ncbi:porin [Caballeronia sp. LZ033]|uniref:porin n=1 Tax=Caballeronia sp. LZ033 TaxID=3038566 RepID=UPI002863C7EB|nr:porin [Caballeronia sp. LZ033]MDR5812305.1 porin [Caballeronia sp. LZ033]
MKKNLIGAAVAAIAASFATAASAQSSVTLYGVLDVGMTFVNNVATGAPAGQPQKGSFRGLTSGNLQESRWGLRGSEDLGGGMKAIFTVESGFSVNNGQSNDSGAIFGRQAWVGMQSGFGTITLGKQFDSVVDYLGPLSAAGTWGGTYFGHVGGNDNLNSDFSIANSIKYQSLNYAGLTFSGLYGFSNNANGFADNRAYSFGAGYTNGPLKLGAAYMQANGVNSTTNGAVTGEQFTNTFGFGPATGQRQRTFGAGAAYSIEAMTFGGVWTQSRLDNTALESGSLVINNYEVNGRYLLTPALALGAAYTFSTAKASGYGKSTDTVKYHQFGVQLDYALSKRTDFHVEGVAQIGSGGAEGFYPTAAIANYNNSFGASSSSRQVLVNTGIRHRF